MINKLRYAVLSSGFIRNCDIARMLQCSPSKASGILKAIKQNIIDNGFKPYDNCVSTKAFLEYVGWKLDEIYAFAMQETLLEAQQKTAASIGQESCG